VSTVLVAIQLKYGVVPEKVEEAYFSWLYVLSATCKIIELIAKIVGEINLISIKISYTL